MPPLLSISAFTGIGSDANNVASGTLTLTWTDASDYVDCSSYSVGSIELSKSFITEIKIK